MPERGKYIVVEGTDGTGKTTVANLLADRAYREGREVIRVDEPDSARRYVPPNTVETPELNPISGQMRAIIKDGRFARQALTNVHLFTASRVESWLSVTRPALERGAWVVGARNYLSTVVYQGYDQGMPVNEILDITRTALGEEYMRPDHLFMLDLDDEVERQRRIDARGEDAEKRDIFEMADANAQQRRLLGYRAIAHQYSIPILLANKPPEELAEDIWSRLG